MRLSVLARLQAHRGFRGGLGALRRPVAVPVIALLLVSGVATTAAAAGGSLLDGGIGVAAQALRTGPLYIAPGASAGTEQQQGALGALVRSDGDGVVAELVDSPALRTYGSPDQMAQYLCTQLELPPATADPGTTVPGYCVVLVGGHLGAYGLLLTDGATDQAVAQAGQRFPDSPQAALSAVVGSLHQALLTLPVGAPTAPVTAAVPAAAKKSTLPYALLGFLIVPVLGLLTWLISRATGFDLLAAASRGDYVDRGTAGM